MSYYIFRNIPVVGGYFRNEEEQQAAKALTKGDEVELCAEPENEHDPLAVAVVSDGYHIGYLPAHSSGALLLLAEVLSNAGGQIVSTVCGTSKKGGWPCLNVVLALDEEN